MLARAMGNARKPQESGSKLYPYVFRSNQAKPRWPWREIVIVWDHRRDTTAVHSSQCFGGNSTAILSAHSAKPGHPPTCLDTFPEKD